MKKCNAKNRCGILKSCDEDAIKAVSEIALNILGGNLAITSGKKNLLKKYRSKLRKLADPKESLKKKRSILVQSGSGVLVSTLLATLLASGITKLIEKF